MGFERAGYPQFNSAIDAFCEIVLWLGLHLGTLSMVRQIRLSCNLIFPPEISSATGLGLSPELSETCQLSASGTCVGSGYTRTAGGSGKKIQRSGPISSDGSSVEPVGCDGIVSDKQVMPNASAAVGSVAYPILDTVLVRNRAKVSRSVSKDLIDAWDGAEFVQIAPSQTSA